MTKVILDTMTELTSKAPLASPTFTGTVTVPTPSNDTDAATKAYVDAVSSGSTFIGCRLTKGSVQSIGTSLTAVTFDTETYDTDTMHDNVTNNTRITFTTAGYYQIDGAFTTDANQNTRAQILLDGATTIFANGAGNAGASTQNGVTISLVYNFTAGQYIEMMGAIGATSNTTSGVSGCFLSAFKVG